LFHLSIFSQVKIDKSSNIWKHCFACTAEFSMVGNGSLSKNQFLPLISGLNIAVLSLCVESLTSFLFGESTPLN
jgi:hypothetical protein